MRSTPLLSKIGLMLLLLVAFVLGMKWIREPDLWWQLRTGQYILETGGLMRNDAFSFTYAGTPWINVKWGFEVVIAWLSNWAGVPAIAILQSLANMAMALLFGKAYKWLLYPKPFLWTPIVLAICAILLFTNEFRMNARPEWISHVFTGLFLWGLLKFKKTHSWHIWLLVPLQALWANLHEGYGTGLILIGGFFLGEVIATLITKKESPKFSRITLRPFLILIGVGILSLAVTAVHPHGFTMWTHPLEIFRQVGSNKFTTELANINSPSYWQKEAYWSLGIASLTVIVLAIWYFTRKRENVNINLPGGYVALWLLTFYLSLTAYRNIPFFIIVATPMLAFALKEIVVPRFKIFTLKRLNTSSWYIVFGLLILSYVGIVSGYYYKHIDDDRDVYGLGIDPLYIPKASSASLANNMKGSDSGLVFSDYLTSSYLLYANAPRFKSYLDLRDLDIFPSQFFDTFQEVVSNPQAFELERKRWRFTSVVLFRNNFLDLHKYLGNSPDWSVASGDAVAITYLLKPRKSTQPLLQKEVSFPQPGISLILPKILNPFYSGFPRERLVAASSAGAQYYTSIGNYAQAELEALSLTFMENKEYKVEGYLALGSMYLERIQTSADSAQIFLSKAQEALNQGLKLDRKDPHNFFLQGRIALATNGLASAKTSFTKSIKSGYRGPEVYILLAEVARRMLLANPAKREVYLEEYRAYLSKAYKSDPNNINVRFYLGIAEGQVGNCKRCKTLLDGILGYPQASKDDKILAKQLFEGCQ